MRDVEFVLKELNKGLYLREMGGIGPRLTASITEAERFATAEEARRHPAYAHPMLSLEPLLVPKKSKGGG